MKCSVAQAHSMYDHDPWGDDDAWGEPGPHTDELADLDCTGPLDEQNDADGTASLTDVDDAPEAESLLLVSASNSAAMVTATALTGGQILRVELAPQVVKLTEHELAEEIIGVSAMARQQAPQRAMPSSPRSCACSDMTQQLLIASSNEISGCQHPIQSSGRKRRCSRTGMQRTTEDKHLLSRHLIHMACWKWG